MLHILNLLETGDNDNVNHLIVASNRKLCIEAVLSLLELVSFDVRPFFLNLYVFPGKRFFVKIIKGLKLKTFFRFAIVVNGSRNS